MSFSSEVKEEISKISNWKDKKNLELELMGYLLTSNCSLQKSKMKFTTENEYNINRFGKVLSNLEMEYEIEIQGNFYSITWTKPKQLENVEMVCDYLQIQKENTLQEEIQPIVRGCFLGGGSLSNPNKNYHLEMMFSCKENAEYIQKMLETYQIHMKKLKRNKDYSLYLKEGEEISKLLALLGASGPVLKFEEIRVLKEMKNNVNRLVNCETANLNKTVETAVRQMEAIKKIEKMGKMKELPDSLQEIAKLRMENPDASLQELGKMLQNPIGKSGVNHRLKKIEELIANWEEK